MNSMNARFKNLVGSKRKSSAGTQSPHGTTTPTGQQRPTSLSPQASNSSSASLPMNPGQNNLGRPPSYTFAQQGNLGAPPNPQHAGGRPASPLPPINTGSYPPNPNQHPGYPPQGGPPGPPGYPPQAPGQYGQPGGGYGAPPPINQGPPPAGAYRPGAVEAPGEARSKAQLIVGIDFVSVLLKQDLRDSC